MKTIRRWWALMVQGWHWHICTCSESFICSRPACGTNYQCVDCEIAEFERWYEAHETRRRREHGEAA